MSADRNIVNATTGRPTTLHVEWNLHEVRCDGLKLVSAVSRGFIILLHSLIAQLLNRNDIQWSVPIPHCL